MDSNRATLAFSGLLITLLAGCATDNGRPKLVSYSCANKIPLDVTYTPAKGSATIVTMGATTELPSQPTGSGFLYGDDRTTLQGKRDQVTWAVRGVPATVCHAR